MDSGFQSYSLEVDSGLQSLVGFRIPSDGFQIPKLIIPDSASKIFWGFRIPDFTGQNFPHSEIRIPFQGASIKFGSWKVSRLSRAKIIRKQQVI